PQGHRQAIGVRARPERGGPPPRGARRRPERARLRPARAGAGHAVARSAEPGAGVWTPVPGAGVRLCYTSIYEQLLIYSGVVMIQGQPDHCDVFHLDPAKVAVLKRRLMAPGSVAALAETFKLLGDTTRVR